MKLLNAFSVNMLENPRNEYGSTSVYFQRVTLIRAQSMLEVHGVESAIGHPSTAAVLSRRLGMEIPVNRVDVRLGSKERALLAQITLPRLAEGEVLSEQQLDQTEVKFYVVDVTYL